MLRAGLITVPQAPFDGSRSYLTYMDIVWWERSDVAIMYLYGSFVFQYKSMLMC
jgi:hypothetical protein